MLRESQENRKEQPLDRQVGSQSRWDGLPEHVGSQETTAPFVLHLWVSLPRIHIPRREAYHLNSGHECRHPD